MSEGNQYSYGIPFDGRFPISRDRLQSDPDPVAESLWLSSLMTEYKLVLLSKYGIGGVGVKLEEKKETKTFKLGRDFELLDLGLNAVSASAAKEGDYDAIILKILEKTRKEESEVLTYIKYGYETRRIHYFITACEMLEKLEYPLSKSVRLHRYEPQASPLTLSSEEYSAVQETATKVLESLKKLGERAEPTLLTLIFSGYRKGITAGIEGLNDQEREFLEGLLDTPFRRAALIVAYGKAYDLKKLIFKITNKIMPSTTFTPYLLVEGIKKMEGLID